MNKETFISALDTLKEADQFITKANNIGIDLIESPIMHLMDTVVSVLEDKDDWVSYWCFQLDYGKKYWDGCVTDQNGNSIDISTPQKLYRQVYQTQE